MTSILIVGSDRYVVDLAVSRGYDVTVVRNTAATQTGLLVFPDCVKEIAVPDQTNLEEILTVIARAGLDVSGFDGVHTNFEFSVAAVATLAAALGKPGIAPHKVAYMRDKFLQKSRLEEAGIRLARTRLATSMADVLDTELGFPVVVKPAAGAGTVNTQRVSEASELSDFARNFFGGGAMTGLLIEEFSSGDEFCLDGWIVDGRVEFGSVGRYAQTCLSVVESGDEMRMYMCSETTYPGLREAAIELAKESLNTLGYTHGVFHLEFFRQNDGSLVFSECAARRGGASIEEEVRSVWLQPRPLRRPRSTSPSACAPHR